MPDVYLPKAYGGAHGLWIEFKAGKGRLSPAQANRAAELVADGYAVVVAYTCTGAIDATLAYLRGELGSSLVVTG